MSEASELDELTRLERQLYLGLEHSDAEALDRIFSERLVYVHSLGIVETKQHNLAGQRSGFHWHGPISRVGGGTRLYGSDLAVTTGPVELVDFAHGPRRTLQLLQTLVWRKEPEGWRLIFRVATRASTA